METEIVIAKDSGKEIMTPAAFGTYMAETIILWFASSRSKAQTKTHEKLTYERHKNKDILDGLSEEDKRQALETFAERMEKALENTNERFWKVPNKKVALKELI